MTVYDAGPQEGFTEQDNTDGTVTVTVTPYDQAENEPFSYLWAGSGNGSTAQSITMDADQVAGLAGVVFDGHGGGKCYYFAFNPWYPPGPPVMPTVSISESDLGGMVFEGDAAHFDIHLSQAVSQNVTVFYNTVDPSSGPAADYVSSYGPQEVTIAAGQTDVTIPVDTVGGMDDGVDGGVTVQLTHPFMCQLAGNGQATATIVHPDVTISSPGETSGTFSVPDDGTLVEVDVSAAVDQAFAGGSEVDLPDVTGLLFWASQNASTPLTPDGNGNVVSDSFSASGQYSRTLWVSIDDGQAPGDGQLSPADQTTPSYTLLAQAKPKTGAAAGASARATARPAAPLGATFPIRTMVSSVCAPPTTTNGVTTGGIDLTPNKVPAGTSNATKANIVTSQVQNVLIQNAKAHQGQANWWDSTPAGANCWNSLSYLFGPPSAADFNGVAGQSNVAFAVHLQVKVSGNPNYPIDFSGSEIMVVPFYWVQINNTKQRQILLPNGKPIIWSPTNTFQHESWHANGVTSTSDTTFQSLVGACALNGYTLASIPGYKAIAQQQVKMLQNAFAALQKSAAGTSPTDAWCMAQCKRW